MQIEVLFTVAEAAHSDRAGATAVVVDVIRASTTMVQALESGATGIYPAASNDDAARLLQAVGREGALLAGERQGLPIEGYDLGNSPTDFTPEAVSGKRIVFNTTNGTRTLLAAEGAERIFVCALTNLAAVVAAIGEAERVLVLCAGRNDRFALDDALCAGLLVQRLVDATAAEVDLSDGARAARELAVATPPTEALLASTASGRQLVDIGLGADLATCAALDRSEVVPQMKERVVRRAHDQEA